MFRKLKRLYLEINCDHPHGDRLALFTAGAEVHICKLCGRFVTILENGTALPEQPRYHKRARPLPHLPERVENYNGQRLSMTDD